MEYLIGVYLIGWVLCSIYLLAETIGKPHKFSDYTKLQLWGVAIFTCFVWPVFVGFWLNAFRKDRQH